MRIDNELLGQSPPPLRQPRTILEEKRLFENVKSVNGKV
jgi:hypothetical protein